MSFSKLQIDNWLEFYECSLLLLGPLWVVVKLTRRGRHPKCDTGKSRIAETPIAHGPEYWFGGDGNRTNTLYLLEARGIWGGDSSNKSDAK